MIRSPASTLTTLLVGALLLTSTVAEAQTIRSQSDSSGPTNVTVVRPGEATIPAQPAQRETSSGDAQAEASGDESSAVTGSYRISLHGTAGTREQERERQRILSLEADEIYRGVIPGKRDEVEHLRRAHEEGSRSDRPNNLTWIGFQPEEQRTRVFFQSPRPMEYQIQRDPDGLVVTFQNATIPARNFSRLIDTSYFHRSVSQIEASQVGDRTVEVRLELRGSPEPTVRTEGKYLFLDFPHRESDASGSQSTDSP